MFGLFVVLIFFLGIAALLVTAPIIYTKVKEIHGVYWETRLLNGIAEIERKEEIDKAHQELNKEMSEW